MATNVLGLMDYVQQQGEKGRQQGLQNRFAQLAGQAYSAAPAQQNALIGQAMGVDPAAGLQLGSQLGAINASRQATAKAAEVDHMKKLGGASRYMAQALKSNNPAQIEGAWQAVRPYLAEVSGKEPPPQWDPAMEPALYQAIAATGGQPDQKGVVLSAGGRLVNPMTGELLANNPQSLQYHDVPMGAGKAAGVFDPSTGTVRPAVGAAAQPGPQAGAGDPMQALLDQANAAIRMGAPEDKVRAWLLEQAQAAGLQPQPAGQGVQDGGNQFQTTQAIVPWPSAAPAQFGIGTPAGPKPRAETWNQPVDETGPDGKPIRVQYSNTGERRVVEGAAPATKAADAKLQMQARAAKSSLSGTVAQLDRLEQAAEQLRSDPGLGGITGFRGHVPDIPGSDAARARALLETLKSQVGFGVLQQMREMSKTGGALGSVSDRENSLLQNNLAALGTNQSLEDFQRALDQVVAYARDSKARLQGAFRDTYGAGDDQPAAAAPPADAARPRATNPQTGEVVEFDGQQWVPVHG